MSGPDPDRVARLFHEAVARPVHEREAFVRARCNGDDVLRVEVLELLACDEEATQAVLRSPIGPDRGAAGGVETGGTIGHYRLLDELGEGGMGRVFRAEQLAPVRRHVALKLMKRVADAGSGRARFQAEQQVLVRLQHRGIARVLDGGHTDEGRPFLVMDLVDGVPLHRWLANGPSVDARLDLFAQVADAVQHAHEKGVIHRDLKPSNVLVVDRDGRAEARVIDFGIARVVSPASGEETLHTVASQSMGTPGYVAPEQVADAAGADVRSDVYALGAVLYEMLTGELPRGRAFDREATAWQREPARVSRKAAGVPADLDPVLRCALAVEPGRRYASVGEFAADVARARAALPVRARRPTLRYLAGRLLRRHRIAAATAAVAALLLLGGAIALFAMWREADRNWQDYRRLVDDKRLVDLRAEARDALWPPWPATLPAIDRFVERVERLAQRRDDIRVRAQQLAARLDDVPHGVERDELAFRHEVLRRLEHGLDEMLADEPRIDNLAGVLARRDEARRVGRVSLERAGVAWREAIAAIADRSLAPAYDGLVLPGPQVGLVPLGQAAHSGLWLFWHVESGAEPELQLDQAGGVVAAKVGEPTGMVFVLVPGGWFTMGALRVGDEHSGTAPIDPDAAPMERFVKDITLAPFFVAQNEMTQGQWLRLTGERPSMIAAGRTVGSIAPDLRWPVEQVSWLEADRVLRRRGLALPTEAQWEYFARAGTRMRFGGVADEAQLDRYANLADAGSTGRLGVPLEPGLDDGHATTAPVGSLLPNPWGLYDVHGNVSEWCRDWLVPYGRAWRDGDGLREPTAEDAPTVRVMRGGDFAERKLLSRVASRNAAPPDQHTARTGLRAVRAVIAP